MSGYWRAIIGKKRNLREKIILLLRVLIKFELSSAIVWGGGDFKIWIYEYYQANIMMDFLRIKINF